MNQYWPHMPSPRQHELTLWDLKKYIDCWQTIYCCFFWRISVGVQMPLLVFILGGTIVNSLAPGRYQLSFRRIIFEINLLINGRGIFCKIVLRWMSLDLLMKSQHWFRWWLGAVRHQAITWVNVDPELCHLTTSKGQSEINHNPLSVILYLWPISL